MKSDQDKQKKKACSQPLIWFKSCGGDNSINRQQLQLASFLSVKAEQLGFWVLPCASFLHSCCVIVGVHFSQLGVALLVSHCN